MAPPHLLVDAIVYTVTYVMSLNCYPCSRFIPYVAACLIARLTAAGVPVTVNNTTHKKTALIRGGFLYVGASR